MKKSFIYSLAAVFALAACTKEADVKVPTGETVTIIASVDQTKSTEDHATFSWATDEQISVGTSDGEYVAFEVADATNGLFSHTFTGETPDLLVAVSPVQAANAQFTGANDYKVELPAIYNDYEPSKGVTNALMIGVPDPNTPNRFLFRHAAALLKITYANVPVETAGFVLKADKPINNGWSGNKVLLGGTSVSDIEIDNTNSALVQENPTIINLKNAVTEANTTLTFYVPVPTGEYSMLQVSLTNGTDEIASTVKKMDCTGKTPLTLNRADVFTFPTITLNPAPVADKYIKVTSEDQIVNEGIYLITSTKTDGDVFAMGTYNSTYFEATEVNVTVPASGDEFIEISTEQVTPVTLVDIGDGLFNIVGPDDNYLYYVSGNSVSYGAFDNTNEVAFSWTVAADEIANVSVPARKLQFNASSPRFACYTTAQRPIALYYKEGSVTVIPTLPEPTNVEAEVDGNSILVTWTDIVAPAGQEIIYLVTCTGQDDQYVEQGEGGCVFENLEDGIYTVSVTALPSDSEYKDSPAVTVGNLEVDAVPDAPSYVKVSSAPADWSGQYLMVCEASKKVLSGISSTSTKYGLGADVTISNGKIEATSNLQSYLLTIAPATEGGSGYTMEFASSYLSWTSGNSLATNATESNNTRWTITAGETAGNWIIANVSDAARVIWYNTGSPRFACYTEKTESSSGYAAIQLYKLEDNRLDPGMSWSASSATASWNTGNTVSGFTAPTLTEGNATGITYESTNPSVATIANDGVVTVVGPGETTIKAIFAGNATYLAKTVSYTLTVTDNRDAVATPVFSPEAGTVAPGTTVTITCATEGATIHYTDDGSNPTDESTTYSGAITLTESKTIKAIAVKEGYKVSAVATAAYAVGVVNTSTEANPYSAAEVVAVAEQLAANGTLSDVYVSGIISQITTAFNSQFSNVSFNISADGLTSGTQFLIFRAHAESADDYKVGDAVEFKGTLINFQGTNQTTTTPELQANAELIYQIHAPSISPDGGNFTDTQAVTITADQGATVRYTLDGTTPTASTGSVYSSALSLTETTTVKAIAMKDGIVTGVVSADFTKSNSEKTNQVLFHETFGNNSGSARDWNDSYSVKSGVSEVYSGISSYTVSNAKQSKNTMGSTQSGLNQTTQGTDAYIIIGPLSVANAENMVLTYQWKAASIKGTYSTALYYATSANGSYTAVSGTGAGATTFVERRYELPVLAQVNTLYLKIVWNTSNTSAIIDEVNLQGDY